MQALGSGLRPAAVRTSCGVGSVVLVADGAGDPASAADGQTLGLGPLADGVVALAVAGHGALSGRAERLGPFAGVGELLLQFGDAVGGSLLSGFALSCDGSLLVHLRVDGVELVEGLLGAVERGLDVGV